MADANSVTQALAGHDENGNRLAYRVVHLLREAQIGDLPTQTDGDAEDANETSSALDQVVTLAKILTRRYNGKDIWDMVAELHDAVVPKK
jgi:hypothetical protein